MNKYEIAVSRFANDLSLGCLIPVNDEPYDGFDFTLNDKEFAEDCELLEKLEYLLRNGRAHIVVEGGEE